jgi:ABC-2 type transport system ATP-binding protein
VSNAAIEVRNLTVVRGKSEVLHDLSVVVPRGSVVGLLGPSGSGKSTLMRSIVGAQIVRSGSISVLGHPAGSVPLRRSVGYVTQAASVYDDLTVTQNLRYFARVLGAPGDDVARVIAEVDLEAHATAIAGELSGGQLNRVSLAAAMLGTPELLVLDEPTVGLDPVLRRDLWALFARLAARGVTLLVSSHVMDEARRCDRLILMHNGRILADETPAGLLATTGTTDPEDAFLALVSSESGPDSASARADQTRPSHDRASVSRAEPPYWSHGLDLL